MSTLTPEQLDKVSPLGHLLLEAVQAGRLPPSAQVEFTTCLTVTIPAASPAVGDLTVLDDGDEYTVYVGHHTHHHHMLWPSEHPSPAEAAQAALEDLVDDLQALVTDRTVIWSNARGSGGTFGIALGPQQLQPGAQAWLWSGRRYP